MRGVRKNGLKTVKTVLFIIIIIKNALYSDPSFKIGHISHFARDNFINAQGSHRIHYHLRR